MGEAKLYTFSISPPGNAAKLMLEHKGIAFREVLVPPGVHPLALHAFGFRGSTVPALKIDGRKVQGSLAISRALDEIKPDPPLFPADPALREKVELAERWGDEFQDLPRIVMRWSLLKHRPSVEWLMRTGWPWAPAPAIGARLSKPLSAYWARRSGATDQRARDTVAALPAALDHVDALIAEGVIGGEQPNAADFQIATNVRACLAAPTLRGAIEGRPCAAWASRLMPEYPGEPMPILLPSDQA
ncbi:MAG: glutathione S-transferase [Thermoleophilia bacterium]|nr:glutathione S-transferase [Thermoleophilia bacterium]